MHKNFSHGFYYWYTFKILEMYVQCGEPGGLYVEYFLHKTVI